MIIKLAVRIITDGSFKNVHSDPAFPQFNYARDSRDFIKDVNRWKTADTSSLSPENTQKLASAIAKAETAINSTYMKTEDFDAVRDEFDKTVFEIQNGTAKPEEKPRVFLKLVTKILKIFSDILLKFFGGNGWSDILLFKNINCGGK